MNKSESGFMINACCVYINGAQCCLDDLVKSHLPVAEWRRVKQQASKYSHADL